MNENNEATKVLSLEDVRGRVQTRKQQGVDLSKLKEFQHDGLGGTVYYGPLPSFALHRLNNIEQYYPLDHPDPKLRGLKASTPELDDQNCERLLLQNGVWTADGKHLDSEIVEWMLKDEQCGRDNLRLSNLIIAETRQTDGAFETKSAHEALDLVTAFTRWDAAFHDLLVKSGWVKYWVDYVTSDDGSTSEAKEAAQKLFKLELATDEWSKRLQAQELIEKLAKL